MPMLDRRIVVRRSVTTFNRFGERVTTDTDWPQWASRVDRTQEDKEQEGGVLTEPVRRYMVRWTRALADALVSELYVIDGTLTLNATNMIEQEERGERRRFIMIEATGEELPP